VVDAAIERAAPVASRDLVVTPVFPFGASDHHFLFGATLSLTAETVTGALLDLARSVGVAGGHRLLIVNGHGGNRGPCHSAAMAASTRYGLRVGYLDYWDLFPGQQREAGPLPPIPGHAGAFESSLIAHLRPELIATLPSRVDAPAVADVADVTIHAQEIWRRLDGYTDDPSGADAQAGSRWLAACASGLADRIIRLVEEL
jgi:creatinine amidohydrolase